MKPRGKLLVGQSGGPTAVMNASLAGVIDEARQYGIEAVYGALGGITGLLAEDFVDLGKRNSAYVARIARCPSAILGSCRHKLSPDDLERALAVLKAHDIHYFVYIGGNDSADTTRRLADGSQAAGYDLRAIAVPKTIDNDLMCTDHCPGYGSAARFIALATAYSAADSRSMASAYQVKVIEVMGRNAGWLAAASAMAGLAGREFAPDIICVPEKAFSPDRFLAQVDRAYTSRGYAVAVATETLRDESGRPLGRLPDTFATDSFGHFRLSGVAPVLAAMVEKELGLVSRWERPGAAQRTFVECISPVDRQEAYACGRAAVRAAFQGQTGLMVTLVREEGPGYNCITSLAPLSEVANKERTLPGEYLRADTDFIQPAFVEYARPLIGPRLPRLPVLGGARVPRLLLW